MYLLEFFYIFKQHIKYGVDFYKSNQVRNFLHRGFDEEYFILELWLNLYFYYATTKYYFYR